MSKRSKTLTAFVIGGIVVLLLAGILIPVFTSSRIKKKQSIRLGEIQEVGVALKVYADDHKGMMPADLDALRPYVPDKEALEGVEFLTPGRKLSDLQGQTVLARRVYRVDKYESVVHADMGVETHEL